MYVNTPGVEARVEYPVMMLEVMLLSHISFILGLAIDYISSQCLVLSAALAVSTRSVWALRANNYEYVKASKSCSTSCCCSGGY